MIFRNVLLAFVYIFASINIFNIGYAEPMLILEFSSQNEVSGGDGVNPFSIDPNYAESYSVKSGDSLNSILKKFYKGSGLDWRFVQLSIVIANPSAFAKNNPNFFFVALAYPIWFVEGSSNGGCDGLLSCSRPSHPEANRRKPNVLTVPFFFM